MPTGSSRRSVAVAVILLAVAFVPALGTAASGDASLAPPFSDFGLDSDGDGLDDALVIVLTVIGGGAAIACIVAFVYLRRRRPR